ncbi:hypothetical protein [Prevotella melaninogenica]|uniref:hypothetical protein n=1 Tax=Prevotella melaninogenica TaxID=28132 RepID=UPI00195DBB46|nr:hypothetical protein [Prevotella melaninogenica]
MKNIRDDRWTDWLIDEGHRWENIDRVKPAKRILGILFLLLVYLIIGLIFAGLSMLVLHVFDLEKIGSNTILPFSFLNSDYKYLFACIALVLSLVTVIYKYRKNNTGERVLFFFIFMLVYSFLIPLMVAVTTPVICYVNRDFGVKEVVERDAVIKEYLGISMRKGRKLKLFYRIKILGTNEEFVFRTSDAIESSKNTPGILYMHRGRFGMYAVDSLRISSDNRSEVFVIDKYKYMR